MAIFDNLLEWTVTVPAAGLPSGITAFVANAGNVYGSTTNGSDGIGTWLGSGEPVIFEFEVTTAFVGVNFPVVQLAVALTYNGSAAPGPFYSFGTAAANAIAYSAGTTHAVVGLPAASLTLGAKHFVIVPPFTPHPISFSGASPTQQNVSFEPTLIIPNYMMVTATGLPQTATGDQYFSAGAMKVRGGLLGNQIKNPADYIFASRMKVR